jgi:D-tyrosyl-tRNA(Tyr) deacylase
MRLVIQRVSEASVDVGGSTVGAIEAGIMVLVSFETRDTMDDVKWVSKKLWNMRLWPNAEDKPWQESVTTKGFGVLLVSQFTLHAKLKGTKPDFHGALEPIKAKVLYNLLVQDVTQSKPANCTVASGTFGATMAVKLINDGPVTLELDSQAVRFPRKIKQPIPATGGGKATGNAQEVDVAWVAPTGHSSVADIVPLELDADGMIGPPDNVLPEGTSMTTMMHAVPDDTVDPVIEVMLPSGMSVKVKLPEGKGAGDVLQIQIPAALMDANFKANQEAARKMEEQGMVLLDFKVPEGKKGGDECGITLPSGLTIKVVVPEDKKPGDIVKVRVPRNVWKQAPQQRINFTIPEGKKAGDECVVTLASGHAVKVMVPEGKVAGDVIPVVVPNSLTRVTVPPGTPRTKIKWTIPEGKGPGDKVSLRLPSGMSVTVAIEKGKKAGDVIEIEVPKPFLDPKFREKQALRLNVCGT